MSVFRFDTLLTLISLGLAIPFSTFVQGAETNPVGTVASVSGTAMIRRGMQTTSAIAPAHPAQVNEPVYKDDVLSTGPDGAIKVLFQDNSIIDLGNSTMFKIEHFEGSNQTNRKASFHLLYGKLRALVTKALSSDAKVEVKTPDAVMGVRGTEFIVNAPATFQRTTTGTAASVVARTELTVVSGSVSFAMPKLGTPPVMVNANMQVTATSSSDGKASQPTAVSPSQLKAVTTESRLADNTFEKTVTIEAGVQNDLAPSAAKSQNIAATEVIVAQQAITSKSEEPTQIRSKGTFGAMDTIRDVPVTILPGLFKNVRVTLGR